ncbi:sugar phosphate isomerase/epimerase family protein [Extibacter muris]|uniref:sugar phosphate isomerase/epimerase family protein n=1 Tax=Extibacter muris TaxID=1796622 RepID=UPI001D0952D4|nr:sugar phosphate isomerase/epimerase family protein [Extibacter muris]MCB6201973.1 sugar phosphate isomerase/epimerase [Extibacter muris]MCQ4663354.1 sugar phosphate isomerase/epimerase [Extibacter muris]MCQ4692606.1 sugar phosphate isomerase/epimerase [Extibacter muris]
MHIQLSLTLTDRIIGSAPFLYEGAFEAGIAYARRLGYDGVELHASDPSALHSPDLTTALKENDIQVTALGTGRLYVNKGLSLTDGDKAVRSEAVCKMKQYIDTAAALRAIVIIGCVRGNVPSPDKYSDTLLLLGESMHTLDDYAARQGVTMVFEPINRYENNYLCSTYEIADFLHTNHLKNIKMMMDTFHMNIEEKNIGQAVTDNIGDIRYVHFADSNRLWPGQGHIDFRQIIEIFSNYKYNGTISAECLPLPTKQDAAVNWLSSAKELLKQI